MPLAGGGPLPLPIARLVSAAGYMLENPEYSLGTRRAVRKTVTIPMADGQTRDHAGKPAGKTGAQTPESSEAIRQPSRQLEKMRWSEPCGDAGRPMSGPLSADCATADSHQVTAFSEIPCRVSNDLPSEGAIPHANPAITGNPSLDHSSGESRGKSRVVVRPSDPVTTEAKAKMAFLRKQIYERHKTPALWDLSEVKG